MDWKRVLVPVCAVLLAPAVFAVINLNMGGPSFVVDSSDVVGATVRTDIDLFNPTEYSGRVETVEFSWSGTCAGAAKIKFFRRVGDTLTLVAERGPFNTNAAPAINTVTLSPAVDVVYGDLIGITRVVDCGTPMVSTGGTSGAPTYLQYDGDLAGAVNLSAGTVRSGWLAVLGQGRGSEYVTSVIPVVGSLAGTSGSFFRTQLQLVLNSGAVGTTTFRLVYHPAGVAGRTTDPSLNVTLARGGSRTLEDLVATIAGSGLGSLDIVTTGGEFATPTVRANVYNDEGVNGTNALVQEAVPMFGNSSILNFPGQYGYLFVPADRTQFRMNIGVRTLQQGAELKIRVLSPAGDELFATGKSYTATFFEQVGLDAFLGFSPPAGSTLEFSSQRGSAIIYGAVTDNRTNDPRVQFVKPLYPEG